MTEIIESYGAAVLLVIGAVGLFVAAVASFGSLLDAIRRDTIP